MQADPVTSSTPRESRTTRVLLTLGALDAVYIALRIVLGGAIPLVGVIAAIGLLIALVIVRMTGGRKS